MKIAVFGLGYVGTVTAAALASRGHDVCGVDVDPVKVDLIGSGRSPVMEPGLDELVARSVAEGALRATTEAAAAVDQADVSLVCVGTPSAATGLADLTGLRRALEHVRSALQVTRPCESGLHAVVVRSTVPPGTVDDVAAPLFRELPASTGWTVGTAMCPEFLREGSSVSDFFDPPLVVVGTADSRVRDVVAQLLSFPGREVHWVDVRTAEALKYACNAFHATKVSFVNEMARIFLAFGVDTREVMELFCQDRVLNVSPAYLRPGFAFGGSCLPKDLRALLHMARMNALDVPLLAGTARTNEIVVRDVVDRLVAGPSRVIAMLGLSFKPDTDDLRESPNVDLVERLIGKGYDVRIYDPIVNPERLVGTNLRHVESRLPHLSGLLACSPGEALRAADTAVVAISDSTVVEELCRARPARIFDLNGRLGLRVEQLPGYEGIGWGA